MRQRRGGVYVYQHRRKWRVDVVSAQGKRGAELFDFEADAQQFAKDTRKALGLAAGTTVQQALDAYEGHLKAKGNEPKSAESTMYKVGRLLGSDWKKRELAQLSAKAAADLYRGITGETKDDGTPKLRPSSHRQMLLEAKTWGRWCVDQKFIRSSPFEAVKGVGKRAKGKEQLYDDEGLRVFEACVARAKAQGPLAVAMALTMGLRASEILVREVRDLDNGGTQLWIPKGKTKSARRKLTVPPDLQEALRALAEGRGSTELLFPGNEGGRHNNSWLRRWTKRMATAAGVKYVCPHGLRGTFTSVALPTIGRKELVVAAAGHSHERMTIGTYAAPGTMEQIEHTQRLKVIAGGRK